MTRSPRRRARRVSLAFLLVATVFTLPIGAWYVRPTTYFSASFNLSGAPGGSGLLAEVGHFDAPSAPGVFTVVSTTGAGGELEVVGGGSPSDAVLVGDFKKSFGGQELRLSFELRPSQSTSALSVRIVDDSDTGMIDCTFGPDGTIRIDGHEVTDYDPGSTYAVTIDLFDPLAGQEFWVVSVKSGATVWMDSGPLALTEQLSADAVQIVVPAGSSAGVFHVDDLKVLSYGLPFGL